MDEDVTPRLVLIRHARPVIDPARPAGVWPLADDARDSVIWLAEVIAPLAADGIVSSPEPKALDTARLIATHSDLPLRENTSLREQGGDTIPWFPEPDRFRAAVREHFSRADEAVFGNESSADATARFAGAVERARARYRVPVLVTHGRVMCGYLGATFGVDPFEIWETLQLPDAIVVDFRSGSVTRVDGRGDGDGIEGERWRDVPARAGPGDTGELRKACRGPRVR